MRKNPYFSYANSFRDLTINGKDLPYGNISPPKIETPNNNSPVVLIMSPHPDDECIMGALPLRLMREADFRVVTCAVTLGSNPERQKERLSELQKACNWIGFKLQELTDDGLDNVTLTERSNNPEKWTQKAAKIKSIFEKWNPTAIFFPNSHDWNKTHLGVHMLTLDALKQTDNFFPFLIETEYWGQIPKPNLLVESTTREVADLLSALSHHEGELKRNPFHLRMPSWMQDNVRRGAEVIGGQGGKAPDFDFATLYRVSRWRDANIIPAWEGGRMLSCSDNSSKTLFSEKK